MEIHGWNLVHSTVINIHSEDKHTHIFNLVEQFVQKNYNLENNLFKDLMIFQKNFLINYNDIKNYDKFLSFDNDIIGYLQGQNQLENKVTYKFEFPEDKTMSLERFCEQIFFARRRNFGKAWVTKL